MDVNSMAELRQADPPAATESFIALKLRLLKEMLRLTSELTISGIKENADAEAEKYVSLISKRETMLEEIKSIDSKLRLNPAKLNTEAAEECDSVIRKIIELDKTNNEKARSVYAHLKETIKGINMGKNISNVYGVDAIESGSAGTVIDIRN